MSPTPAVSVLLPCRDGAATVSAALDSISAQTFGDFEVIAVDDGSTDETPDLLAELGDRDGRIRILPAEGNGIVAALNQAAGLARGALLARMDADDISAPTRFEKQVALLRADTGIAACGTGIRYFPRNAVRAGARRYERWINGVVSTDEIERDLFVECPIPHPSLMMRRAAFQRVGGYRDAGWPEDYDLVLRLWEAGLRLGKVPEVLLEWRERPDRLSRTDERYSEDAFRRCKVHFLERRIAGRRVVVWGAGPVGKSFALALKEREQMVTAFVDLDRRKIGQVIHGAPVVHPSAINEYRGCYAVAAVGSSEARHQIRGMLRAEGFREPEECCAVA